MHDYSSINIALKLDSLGKIFSNVSLNLHAYVSPLTLKIKRVKDVVIRGRGSFNSIQIW